MNSNHESGFLLRERIDEQHHLKELIMEASSKKGRPLRTVFRLALFSRILLGILFLFWRNVANSYDTSADLSLPCLSTSNNSSGAVIISSNPIETEPSVWSRSFGKALERTIVWDGVYYVRIAECGYEYEQAHAFLPALPLLMRFLSNTIFFKFIPTLGLRATLALSGYVINNIAFVLAACFFYRLTEQVLEDEKQAVLAVALFCFNPASTFYSAIYSESLFALCSFAGLDHFLRGEKWTSIILFGLSTGVRSNGVLHAGFFLFQAMHKVYHVALRQRRLLAVVPIIVVALFQSIVIATPFVAFQRYGFSQLCLQEGMLARRPWCKTTVPYLYGFVQSHYWDVGFCVTFSSSNSPIFC